MKEIRESRELLDDTAEKLTDVINEFKEGFATSGGGSVVPDEHIEALDQEKLRKQAVRVRKPAPPKKK